MRHNEKSENIARGRRLLVVASQPVGVVAVHRPHRRPNPFVSGQSFHFQMTGALGDTMLIPLSLTVRVLRREPISTSATRRANRGEKNMVQEKNEVSRRYFQKMSRNVDRLIILQEVDGKECWMVA